MPFHGPSPIRAIALSRPLSETMRVEWRPRKMTRPRTKIVMGSFALRPESFAKREG